MDEGDALNIEGEVGGGFDMDLDVFAGGLECEHGSGGF